MLDKLHHLEQKALPLEPNSNEMRLMNEQVTNFAQTFVEQIYDVKAYITSENKGENIKDFSISNEPENIDVLLKAIQQNIYT